MAYSYRARYGERIAAGAIVHGTPEAVAHWFEACWQPPQTQEFTKWSFEDSERGLLEHLAVRRREPLIDHAVARWGYSLRSIQRVHNRGDASTRTAALANPRGGALLAQAQEVVKSGRLVEMHAMLQSPFLDGSFLDDLLCRTGKFNGLPNDRLLRAIWCLKGSKRLASRYDGFDGMSELHYNKPSFSAWQLALTIPVDSGWASSLDDLLATCLGSLTREKAPEALERWRIDPPLKEGAQWFNRPSSFFLRVRLAGALPAEGNLLESDDPALRVSFYRRFLPHKWKEWPGFLDRDGSDFVAAAIENEHLWRTEELRDALRAVCGKCKEPSTQSTMHCDFWIRQRLHQEKHPEWFAYKEDAPPEPSGSKEIAPDLSAILELMLDGMEATRARLDGIDAAIRGLPPPRRSFF